MEVVFLGQIHQPAERSEAGGTRTTYRAPAAHNKEKNRLSKERETRGMEVVVLGQIWPSADKIFLDHFLRLYIRFCVFYFSTVL